MAFPAVFLKSSDNPQAVLGWFHSSGWRPSDQEPMGFTGGHGHFETSRSAVLGVYGFVMEGENGGSSVVFWAIPKRLRTGTANQELAALARALPSSQPAKFPGLRQKRGVLKFFLPG